MKIDIINVSPYVTNCYILTKNDEVLVIDPGGDYEKIKPFLKGKNILGAVITHGHDDHNAEAFNFSNITIIKFSILIFSWICFPYMTITSSNSCKFTFYFS